MNSLIILLICGGNRLSLVVRIHVNIDFGKLWTLVVCSDVNVSIIRASIGGIHRPTLWPIADLYMRTDLFTDPFTPKKKSLLSRLPFLILCQVRARFHRKRIHLRCAQYLQNQSIDLQPKSK